VPAPSTAASAAPLPQNVPDAIPRFEPRSLYGNPPFYEVFGKRYYVMATSVNYLERGVASWYGPGFHKVRTSIGEPYDMYGMTAAHKTLPLPA
jgi:rare lipoprotein A